MPVDNFSVPDLSSEASLAEWGQKIIEGERKRTSQGGIPIYNPTIAKVKVHYDIFMEGYEKQKSLQSLTNRSLEQLASCVCKPTGCILDTGIRWKPNSRMYRPMRNAWKSRDYGLIYYYRTGEKQNKEIL